MVKNESLTRGAVLDAIYKYGIIPFSLVKCEPRHRSYPYHPELDYDYIKCGKDGLEFETTLKEGDLPVLQLVAYRGGNRFGLNHMFGQMELA